MSGMCSVCGETDFGWGYCPACGHPNAASSGDDGDLDDEDSDDDEDDDDEEDDFDDDV